MKIFLPFYSKSVAILTIVIFFFVSLAHGQSPTISSFNPPGSCSNTSSIITIFGNNFTGATAVSIGNKPVDSFTVKNANTIIATIQPKSAGTIKITTARGTVSSIGTFTNTSSYTAYAYIANNGSNSVSVINTDTYRVIATVKVGSQPQGIGVSPDGTAAYVANNYDGTVSVINTASNTVEATVTVGINPLGVCVSPDGTKVYVANYGDGINPGTVSVINSTSNTVSATVTVGVGPKGVCVSPDGTSVYVSNNYDGTVSVINTATNLVTSTITVGNNPLGISVNPYGTKVYVANYGNNSNPSTVSVINSANNTVVKTVPVGIHPYGLNFSPDGTTAYVTNLGDPYPATVSIINTSSNTTNGKLSVGGMPSGVCVTPDGKAIYVVNQNSQTVSVNSSIGGYNLIGVSVGYEPISLGNFIANVPTACGTQTPVTIETLEAVNENRDIAFRWSTATELNISHFIIQHSTDGSSFTDIGTVKAIGSGSNSYSFTDNNAANGINYYRLKSVDKDGGASYSKVVSCELSVVSKQLTVYPNPAKDNVTIRGSHIVSVQMIDNMGRVVKVVSFRDATNPTLSVSGLVNGVYHLRIQTVDGDVSGNQLVIYN